ncbi:MAG: HDOD domain-containing protein [Leptospirales bacterium]
MEKLRNPDLADFSARLKKYVTLPAASSIVHEVLQSIDRESASFHQTAAAIEQDPSLSLQVLRSANSLASSYSGRVLSVIHAVRLLGFRTLKGIVMATVLLDRSRNHPGIPELWIHSQIVSLNCRILSRYLKVPWEEEAQTVGLLHDIGKVFFYEEFPGYYEQEFQLGDSDRAVPDWTRERDVFGIDHSFVGNKISKAFGLPKIISEPILFMHQPPVAMTFPELTHVLIVADGMAKAMGHGTPEFDFVEPGFQDALHRLALDEGDIEVLLAESLGRSATVELLSL